ncbi:MAG: DUF3800 domain-containing protein [Candidatus Eisenbacteria bacterium]|uniref:DUF3800 domain-containing protein n=1 Tax=Eiseniibacteriota bacterium TaxID=2212470 RepID=A0A933SFI5_UNCEI|nr:DUF3800 domain-containing protein [Candidatus Eisenbacteria bacterium]
MHFAYVDESGSVGSSGSKTFTLGCVLVEDGQWMHSIDGLIDFRRYLKQRFAVPVRSELKANWLVQNTGSIRELHLSERARRSIFQGHLRLIPKLGAKAFAVVIDKALLEQRKPGDDPRRKAWEFLIQRLERYSTKNGVFMSLFHDEGEARLIRQIVRRTRRAGSAGSMFNNERLHRPATRLLEDPNPRKSHESYFIQLADLVAYAAFRRAFPIQHAGRFEVVQSTAWDGIDAGLLREVSSQGPHPGIVLWPR